LFGIKKEKMTSAIAALPSSTEMSLYQILDLVAKIILGLATSLIALLVYLQNRKDSKANWERCFSELHNNFWIDKDLRCVRKWLVNEDSYSELKPILEKRMNHGGHAIEKGEYDSIDRLDKFLNYLSRIVYLVPVTKEQAEIWENFFFGYWIKQCLSGEKKEIQWYVERFYKNLLEGSLRTTLLDMKIKNIK
jgi:hypothetical protein